MDILHFLEYQCMFVCCKQLQINAESQIVAEQSSNTLKLWTVAPNLGMIAQAWEMFCCNTHPT